MCVRDQVNDTCPQDILLAYAASVKYIADNGMTEEERAAIDWPMVYKDAISVCCEGPL